MKPRFCRPSPERIPPLYLDSSESDCFFLDYQTQYNFSWGSTLRPVVVPGEMRDRSGNPLDRGAYTWRQLRVLSVRSTASSGDRIMLIPLLLLNRPLPDTRPARHDLHTPRLRLPDAVARARTASEEGTEGQITPFNALATALSATIGTGNIAGVAHRHLPGRSGRGFLDVDDGPGRHGHQVCRGRPGGEVSRGRRDWATMSAARCTTSRTASAKTGSGSASCSPSSAPSPPSASAMPSRPTPWRPGRQRPFRHCHLWLTAVVLAVLVFLVIIGGIKRARRSRRQAGPADGRPLRPRRSLTIIFMPISTSCRRPSA